MFAKVKVKPTLSETYEEAVRVEAERESIEDYPEQWGEKKIVRKPYYLLILRRSSHVTLKEC